MADTTERSAARHAPTQSPTQSSAHPSAHPSARPQPGELGKAGRSARLGNLASIAGALTSVALVVGLGVWGYRLAVRDVTGVPVIRALEGPARIAPDDPGGELARHTGLSVNGVAEDGTAAPPADRLALAPQVAELGEDALPMASLRPMPRASVPLSPQAEAADAALAEPEVAATASLTEDSAPVDEAARAAALADDLSDGVAPLEPLEEGAPPPTELLPKALDPELAADPETQAGPAEDAIAANVPGVARSPRPISRPISRPDVPADAQLAVDNLPPSIASDAISAALAEALAPEATARAALREVDPDTLAPGTRLVQLGAFEDEDTARREWDKVAARFGAMMEGKGRVIQKTESGGRAFYRLRVEGFADVSDARRFCAALLAESTLCIPAQVR